MEGVARPRHVHVGPRMLTRPRVTGGGRVSTHRHPHRAGRRGRHAAHRPLEPHHLRGQVRPLHLDVPLRDLSAGVKAHRPDLVLDVRGRDLTSELTGSRWPPVLAILEAEEVMRYVNLIV